MQEHSHRKGQLTMLVRQDFKCTTLKNADYGQMLMFEFGGDEVVRGVKGYLQGNDGNKIDYFAAFAPPHSGDKDIPILHEIKNLHNLPALDITEAVEIIPSLNPTDISCEALWQQDCIGKLFLLPSSTFLGVTSNGGFGRPCFLNLDTGEILLNIDGDQKVYHTRRWRLINKKHIETESILHEHKVAKPE